MDFSFVRGSVMPIVKLLKMLLSQQGRKIEYSTKRFKSSEPLLIILEHLCV